MEQLIKVLKSVVFYPMLWLRGIFRLVGKGLSGLFLLGLILGLFIHLSVGILILFGVFSLGFFLLTFFYDQILLKLNPTGNTLILNI